MNSDKENEQPETRANTPRRGKAGGMRSASVRMPTPDSGSTTGNGSKRRRTDNYAMAQPQIYDDGNDEHEEEEEEEEEDMHEVETPSQPPPESDEEGDQKYYNPNQNPEQRRRLRANMRDNHRMLEGESSNLVHVACTSLTTADNRDDYVKSRDSGLLDAIKTQNSLFGKVRQTADATVDSCFLVSASDLAGKKLNNSLGNSGVGIDLDQFVSKCIYFMKSGGHIAGEEDAPALAVGDDDEEDPDGLDWALLGRRACFPRNRRPPTSSFLLGPLSVQRRVRVTQKKARSQRQPLGPATRPQEIQTGDIQQNESNNLTTLVRGIRSRLEQHITVSQTLVQEEIDAIPDDEYTADAPIAALRRHRIAMTKEEEPAVNLLDFAINPHDFGQTVENLFYISFLVKEGNAKIVKDAHGLPLLLPAAPSGVSEHRERDVQKHQAVFSLDFPSWRMSIEAYDITTPLIPQRQVEEATVGANGWYNG
ncbi:hypothetical protein J4E86_009335 [Alternaria arbusti]|uniref:uncharacterized protein n=1 Tax=Alternaria arbusti TaxID=232088 RepID=UPI00221E3955|nr:uncharacterized protein J4E86_009335 [Alternaria arbusti]KAI4945448.1 hypothetical protein J4E86_009335 [Alternaria arbusti]